MFASASGARPDAKPSFLNPETSGPVETTHPIDDAQAARHVAQAEQKRFARSMKESVAPKEPSETASMARNAALAEYLYHQAATWDQEEMNDEWERIHFLRDAEMKLETALREAEGRPPELQKSSGGLRERTALHKALEKVKSARQQLFGEPQESSSNHSSQEASSVPQSERETEETPKLPSMEELRAAAEQERAQRLKELNAQKNELTKKLQKHQLHRDPSMAHPNTTAEIGTKLEEISSAARSMLMQPPSDSVPAPQHAVARSRPAASDVKLSGGSGIRAWLGKLIGHEISLPSLRTDQEPVLAHPHESRKATKTIAEAKKIGIKNAQVIFDKIASHFFEKSINFLPEEFIEQLTLAKLEGKHGLEHQRLRDMTNELYAYGLDITPLLKPEPKPRRVIKEVRQVEAV